MNCFTGENKIAIFDVDGKYFNGEET